MLERVEESFGKLVGSVVKHVAHKSGRDRPSAAYDQKLVRRTRSGFLRGCIDSGAQAFLGIPFAQPPLGDLRWRAPRDPYAWEGERDATLLPANNLCAQIGSYFGLPNPETFFKAIGSEDCLYLNVWRPDTKESKLPILFWIHGGANLKGASTERLYHGATLAKKANCIVVTANYRLGSLGWFYNAILDDGTLEDQSGNYGTLDLIKALEWVRDNIEEFGGDPGCVTLAGQSAGGINAWGLMQSPLAKGLFHRAIICSGLPNSYPKEFGQIQSDQVIDALLVEYGRAKNTLEAAAYRLQAGSAKMREFLRGEVKAEDIAKYSPNPVISNHFNDGLVISSLGLPAIFVGHYSKVPLIIGTTADEGTLFFSAVPGVLRPDLKELWRLINDVPSSDLKPTDIIKQELYPLFGPVSRIMSLTVAVAIDDICRLLNLFQGEIYRYSFSWKQEPAPWREVFGATHGIDMGFLFGNFPTPDFSSFAWDAANEAKRRALSDSFIKYVANFMRTGNPNVIGDGLPRWRAWSWWRLCDNQLVFDEKIHSASTYGKRMKLALWHLRMDDETKGLVDMLVEGFHLKIQKPVPRSLFLHSWMNDEEVKEAVRALSKRIRLHLRLDTLVRWPQG